MPMGKGGSLDIGTLPAGVGLEAFLKGTRFLLVWFLVSSLLRSWTVPLQPLKQQDLRGAWALCTEVNFICTAKL